MILVWCNGTGLTALDLSQLLQVIEDIIDLLQAIKT